MKPRVTVALAFGGNVVCSGGNGLVYQGVKVIWLKKHSIEVITKKVHCPERMETLYEETNIL